MGMLIPTTILATRIGQSLQETAGLFDVNYYDPKYEKIAGKADASGRSLKDKDEKFDRFADAYRAHTPMKESFGDLRLLDWDVYDNNSAEVNRRIVEVIEKNFQQAHPSILAFQGMRKNVLEKVMKYLSTNPAHYGILNTEKTEKNALIYAALYLPIIYDKLVLELVKSGYFKKPDNDIYGSYAIFRDQRNGKRFLVANMDVFTVEESVLEGEVFKIVKDVTGTREIGSLPAILMGGIGKSTKNVKNILDIRFINTLDKDKNNESFFKTTAHGRNGNNDNKQRDFILIREDNNIFTINLSRILTVKLTDIGQHYPIESILSYKKV